MELYPHNFMHVLPKKNYSYFRLRPKNIVIGCFGCHTVIDHYTDQAMDGNVPNQMFEWFFKLRSSLLQQYLRLEKSNVLWLIGKPDAGGSSYKRIKNRYRDE
jgi:hypothetical protein